MNQFQAMCRLAWAFVMGLVLIQTTMAVEGGEVVVPAFAYGQVKGDSVALALSLPPSRKDTGSVVVTVVDGAGVVRFSQKRDVALAAEWTTHVFNCELKPQPKDQVRVEFDGKALVLALDAVLLKAPVESRIRLGLQWHSGSSTPLEVVTTGPVSLESNPCIPGVEVAAELMVNGKNTRLVRGLTDANGRISLQLPVPELEPGQYLLRLVTRSALGESVQEKQVQIVRAPRLLLTTDKPVYQPGQMIHQRLLALDSFSQKPVAGKAVVFEVEDAKGNKVFKKQAILSPHGVAHVDFQLADEVNQGSFQIRALLGDDTASKTVTVKPYQLPRFKTSLKLDRPWYQPGEKVRATIQSDYFFGKPVSGASFVLKALSMDVQAKEFFRYSGKTKDTGTAEVEIVLPRNLVGLPAKQGDAIVLVQMELTDTAEHTEKVETNVSVSDRPIRLKALAEGGRLVPELENRVVVAATYPDGTPAKATVKFWPGVNKIREPLVATTGENGLAEFAFTPRADWFTQSGFGEQTIEVIGQAQPVQNVGPKTELPIKLEATDATGAKAEAQSVLTGVTKGDNLVLRLNRAVFNAGQSLVADVLVDSPVPTVYLDFIKDGQVVLSQWLDVKNGKARLEVALPQEVSGSLEVHAWQVMPTGELVRDSRLVYAQPSKDLKVEIIPSSAQYRPGEKGSVELRVTDASGKPAAAALGVLVVDEAVYALQDQQPGMEKVFFTLQKQLLEPKAQELVPGVGAPGVLIQPRVIDDQAQIAARALFGAVRPAIPKSWVTEPAVERRQKAEQLLMNLGFALHNFSQTEPVWDRRDLGKWAPNLLKAMADKGYIQIATLKDPLGGELSLESLGAIESGFSAKRLAEVVTRDRLRYWSWMLVNASNQAENRARWLRNGQWDLPKDVLDLQNIRQPGGISRTDPWGNLIVVVPRKEKGRLQQGLEVLAGWVLASPGPDGKLGTPDDIRLEDLNSDGADQYWWLSPEKAKAMSLPGRRLGGMDGPGVFFGGGMPGGGGMVRRGAGGPMAAPMVMADGAPRAMAMEKSAMAPGVANASTSGNGPGLVEPTRTREFFPETMLWRPSLVTNDQGVAQLDFDFADSITTWRMTATASTLGGLLGGASAPLRVFQDFFVEMDLPLALTQGDEVRFPVAVFNYLKKPQKVVLTLKPESWYELVDGQSNIREVEIGANQVGSVAFRVRAKQLGAFPLQLDARGSAMADSVRRTVRVAPNGEAVELAHNERLSGRIEKTLNFPVDALPGANQALLKIHPGLFSQLVEGTDGILRMPGGCFEQTSSSAYPNVLVVDYIKRNRLGAVETLAKSEAYLNAGYQRLLTFERPGGGFDWWGSGEPLIWLSAYGLMEFNDMAKVWPVDRGVIERTQNWLLGQMDGQGLWSKIGATHGESIERMGDPKLLLTSYVSWALLESGVPADRLAKSLAYIRAQAPAAENAYILALAANALTAASTTDKDAGKILETVLARLDQRSEEKPEWQARCFPAADGESLNHARGNSLTVETTALAALALLKSTNPEANVKAQKALAYLAKARDPHGTWGSTQATILALKALVAASSAPKQTTPAKFSILVDGKEIAKGEVNSANSDVMQQFDLSAAVSNSGDHKVLISVDGESAMVAQLVSRYYRPWSSASRPKQRFDLKVDYDRTTLEADQTIQAKASLRYLADRPTSMVMLDLGIPPGFTADADDWNKLVASNQVKKFSMTNRQIIVYLQDIEPGKEYAFTYTLKAKFAVKAKAPAAEAYEYYNPTERGASQPVDIEVKQKGN